MECGLGMRIQDTQSTRGMRPGCEACGLGMKIHEDTSTCASFDCSFLCITIRVYPIAGVHTVHGNTISGRARAKTCRLPT